MIYLKLKKVLKVAKTIDAKSEESTIKEK